MVGDMCRPSAGLGLIIIAGRARTAPETRFALRKPVQEARRNGRGRADRPATIIGPACRDGGARHM